MMSEERANKQRNPARRARGEGRIFQRGAIAWIQFYDAQGRQVRESTEIEVRSVADQRKVEKKLRQRLGEVAAGIVRDSRSIRYADLRESYMDEYAANSRKSLRCSKSGEPYLEAVKRLDDFFAGYCAADIDADLIRKFQRNRQAAGLANGSINRSVSALRRMFTLALRDGKLRNTPYFPMLPEAVARKGTLPQEKYAELLAALPDYIRPIVTIGFRTGMRLSEILNLRWSNVLWIDHLIRLDEGTTKNNEAREIPLSAEIEAVLKSQFAMRQPDCDRVCFRLDRKGNARPIGNFRKPWRRACVRIGVGRIEPVLDAGGQPVFAKPRYPRSKPKPKMMYAGLIFHDLRRTFITDAENSGAPRHEVMKISGHKTESVYKRYAIENREQRRAAMRQIDAYRAQKFGDNSGTTEESLKQEDAVTN